MKNVKVLGPGCAKCKSTHLLIMDVCREKNVAITLEKVEEFPRIAALGVMATPSVIIDDVIVHTGSVPNREKVMSWFT